MTTPVTRRMQERASADAVSRMGLADAISEATELLEDYFDDVEEGTDFSSYDPGDAGLKLDRLADVSARLRHG